MLRSTISFRVLPFEADIVQVVPVIDGELLTDIVARVLSFAQTRSQTSNDKYAGLIPAYFRFGLARSHFYGQHGASKISDRIPLLGCSCGEWGCDPVLAKIEMSKSHVTWSNFSGGNPKSVSQFSGLHFEFERRAYDAAVIGVSEIWDAFQ
jgi:hypothetical protein